MASFTSQREKSPEKPGQRKRQKRRKPEWPDKQQPQPVLSRSTEKFFRNTNLIKGMFHKRPPSHSLVPAWDLPRVLRFLAEPPFETMDQVNTMDLTHLLAFLMVAAWPQSLRNTPLLAAESQKYTLYLRQRIILNYAGMPPISSQEPAFGGEPDPGFYTNSNYPPRLTQSRQIPGLWPLVPSKSFRYYVHRQYGTLSK